jgi:hypothetical protein
LIEKCETRKSGFELSLDKNFPDDVIIWMAMLPWDIERLPEDLYTRFGNNTITDVVIKYYPTYGDVLNRPEFIPEIKEKLRIEKGYILTESHNYKLMNLYILLQNNFIISTTCSLQIFRISYLCQSNLA